MQSYISRVHSDSAVININVQSI